MLKLIYKLVKILNEYNIKLFLFRLKVNLMKKRKTIYHLLVDESSSMCDCEESIVNGINEQINKIKNFESEFPEDDVLLGLTTFNDKTKHHFLKSKPSDIQLIKFDSFEPFGSTALLDAIGQTIEMLENELDITENTVQISIVVIILTDGFDNYSKYYDFEDIKNRILRLELTGRWYFRFLGANFNAIKVKSEDSTIYHKSFKFENWVFNNKIWQNLINSMKNFDKKDN
jgi:hypothetical protein